MGTSRLGVGNVAYVTATSCSYGQRFMAFTTSLLESIRWLECLDAWLVYDGQDMTIDSSRK